MNVEIPPEAHGRLSVSFKKVIEPPSGWPALNLTEVWRYRDLLFMLIWRDISSRYRQSVIGYGWAALQVTAVADGGRLAGVRRDRRPPQQAGHPVTADDFCRTAAVDVFLQLPDRRQQQRGRFGESAHEGVYFPRL